MDDKANREAAPVDWDFFGAALLNWYQPERRPMPWKAEKNPYYIWLSEIILQQTRVAQGQPYFERFKAAYPCVGDLAAAPDDEVMKLWEGLGYYSRARNLLKTARIVQSSYGGHFPTSYAELLQLPGVGAYTAAAIAAFAYEEAVAVVDGNVFRVLARYANDPQAIDTTAGKKHFTAIANLALRQHPPAIYNQAIMDFGALVCSPQQPDCSHCPLSKVCSAKKAQTVAVLPHKSKKISRRRRHFHFLILQLPNGEVPIEKRGEGDVWRDLYQFPMIETQTAYHSTQAFLAQAPFPKWLEKENLHLLQIAPPKRQQLTHQDIVAYFYTFAVESLHDIPENTVLCSRKNLGKYAFPKVINDYLQEKTLYLGLF